MWGGAGRYREIWGDMGRYAASPRVRARRRRAHRWRGPKRSRSPPTPAAETWPRSSQERQPRGSLDAAERQPRCSRCRREAAERQPRGSREAAERQPGGSREAAGRQPRGSREAAGREGAHACASEMTPQSSSAYGERWGDVGRYTASRARDMGRYGEIWGDLGRCAPR